MKGFWPRGVANRGGVCRVPGPFIDQAQPRGPYKGQTL